MSNKPKRHSRLVTSGMMARMGAARQLGWPGQKIVEYMVRRYNMNPWTVQVYASKYFGKMPKQKRAWKERFRKWKETAIRTREQRSQLYSNAWNRLTPEEKAERARRFPFTTMSKAELRQLSRQAVKARLAKYSPAERSAIASRTQLARWRNLTPQERAEIAEHVSEGLKRYYRSAPRELIRVNMRHAAQTFWDRLSPFERSQLLRARLANMPSQRRRAWSEKTSRRMKQFWGELTAYERAVRVAETVGVRKFVSKVGFKPKGILYPGSRSKFDTHKMASCRIILAGFLFKQKKPMLRNELLRFAQKRKIAVSVVQLNDILDQLIALNAVHELKDKPDYFEWID